MEKILIVDDDTFLLDMYATKFTESGYTVGTAKSAEEALRRLREGEKYDAIVLDMIMPRMGGIELLQALHEEKMDTRMVTIVLSNQGEKSDIEAAYDIGVDGYFIKANLVPSEVVKEVSACIAQRKKK